MSFICASCDAYVSSGFAIDGGVGIVAGAGVALGDGSAGEFEDPEEAVGDEAEEGVLPQGFAPVIPAPAPMLAPLSNIEKSRPPGGVGGVPKNTTEHKQKIK